MLAYDIRGCGPGLVLLHGIASTATATWGPWSTVSRPSTPSYFPICPDRGAARCPAARWKQGPWPTKSWPPPAEPGWTTS